MPDPFSVVLLGGITASTRPFGAGGWWRALERVFPPARHPVVCPPWRPSPGCSTFDLADRMAPEVPEGSVVVGASLGGLVGLALALRHPARVRALVSVSAGLGPDPWGTGVRHLQRELVRDGLRSGEVHTAMARARQLGMLTYRGREELAERFGPLVGDAPPIASYLDHNGEKFATGFDPQRFLQLSEAIDRSTLPPGAELSRLPRTEVVGVPGDLLFPFDLQRSMRRSLDAAGVRGRLWTLQSRTGHDAFLADQDQLAELIDEMFRGDPP